MKHYVHFDTRPYKTKPKNVGVIQNYVLKQSPVEQLTIHEIIERATNGYTLIASKLNELREVEVTSLIFIDIDDDDNVTKLDDFKYLFDGRLTAYYYSFSYIEGTNNRLRLVFQLEEPVTPVLHSYIVGELIKEMQTYFEARNIDLTGTGIIDDKASENSKRLFFGTSKGGAVLDESARIGILAIDHYKNKHREESEEEVRLKHRKRIDNHVPKESEEIPFETLKAMAETIGGIPSGPRVEWIDGETVSANRAWSDLIHSIRHYEKEGFISEAESFELCELISGDGLKDKEFDERQKPDGRLTIGTFIKYAIQRGYHFNNSYKQDTDAYSLPADKKHTVDVKEYVSKDFMKELLQKPIRTLVDSPTGSGKTYATVEAMKELAKENRSHIYVIASPTRALASQIAREREIPLVIGGTNNSKKSIEELWQKGERVLSSTYDQVQKIVESVPANELILVVDEVHKLTTDREFRNDTIQKVIDTADKARTFVGITGTSADVYELMFDEKQTIKVSKAEIPASSKVSKAEIPASSFHVLQYTTAVPDVEKGGYKTDKRMELLTITHLIKLEYQKHNIRSLVFLNNKKLIEAVAAELEKDGMNVFKVYREEGEEDSGAYEKVVANNIDDDVDVILATKRIADGISLTFNSINWNIIVLSDNRTRTFNPSEVRQMFHRIRSPYRNAILITRLPDQQSRVNEKAVRFHKNRFMNVLHRRAKVIKQHYDDLMINVTEDEFYKLEKAYGLYAKDGEACIDLNVLNAEAVREKELYYSKVENRDLFIKEVAAGIGFNKYSKNTFDYTLLGDKLDELLNGLEEEEEKLTAEELQERFIEFYTPSVHTALHNGNTESVLGTNNRLLKKYRERYGEARINAMPNVAKTVESHEKARDILVGITRRKEQNYFMDRLQVRNTHHAWHRRQQQKKAKSYTQKKYEEIIKEVSERVYTASSLKEVKKDIAKRHNLKSEDVNNILKLYTTIEDKTSRLTLYEFLEYSVSIEAKTFNMDQSEFNDAAISLLSIDELKKYAVGIEVKK